MTKTELAEMIRRGETPQVEFKRDQIHAGRLAKEMFALLNYNGGHILLGVDDDCTVSGLSRDATKAKEWVMEVARRHIQPAAIVFWDAIAWKDGRVVGIVTLPRGAPDKPYKAKRSGAWLTLVRVGTTTRDATRAEEERLYQQSQSMRFRYGLKPVFGATLDSLDIRRLRNYFGEIRPGEVPAFSDMDQWNRLLVNFDLAIESQGRTVATVDGVNLFGKDPRRFLPRTGVRAVCYLGTEQSYETRADEVLSGPMVPLCAQDGSIVEYGLVDKAWAFVRRNTSPSVRFDGARRIDRWIYPESPVREAVANALVHRDYSIEGTDILLEIFEDRFEIQSPGCLPNTMTTDKMKEGFRYARNQILVNVLRDYGYIEDRGMGVRLKIIPGMMQHNGTEPDLIEDDDRFIVRLWR